MREKTSIFFGLEDFIFIEILSFLHYFAHTKLVQSRATGNCLFKKRKSPCFFKSRKSYI